MFYIPKSIWFEFGSKAVYRTLVFLHGGGANTTTTDEGATNISLSYMNDLIPYAERNQVILLLSTTTFGWNQHTRYFLREFLADVNQQIAIDLDHVVLAGHSMGGMGITREYSYLTDIFSGFLTLSAGTQSYVTRDDRYVLPILNGTPYTQLNGTHDEDPAFRVWHSQNKALLARVQQLEVTHQRQAHYQIGQWLGGHDADPLKMYQALDDLFTYKRQHYPKAFDAPLSVNRTRKSGAAPAVHGVIDQAFWIKVSDYARCGENQIIGANLTAEVVGQKITITTRNDTFLAKRMTLTLSSELLDLQKPVQVLFNGSAVFDSSLPAANEKGEVLVEVDVRN